ARALVSEETEDAVLAHGAANSPSELVAFERIVHRRKEVPRVHVAVAQKFEQRTMELIGAGFGNYVHHTAGVESVAGGEAIRLHAELLNGIGKREWKADVGVAVIVIAAIHQEVGAIGLPTRNRHG